MPCSAELAARMVCQAVPNGVIRIFPNSARRLIANLSAFQKTHPVANPNPGDFEPDGTWYSMIAVGGDLYAVEPNHGELDKITTWGQISRVVDISASQGHIVPTAIAFHNGNFYVGNLNTFPIVPGSSKVLKITPNGQITVFRQQVSPLFLALLSIPQDRLYVLENTTGRKPIPNAGDRQSDTNWSIR